MPDKLKSNLKKIIGQRGYSVQKINFRDANKEECYAVILMSQEKVADFKTAYSSGSLNLEDWGKVLFTGYGKDVPELEQLFIDEVFADQKI